MKVVAHLIDEPVLVWGMDPKFCMLFWGNNAIPKGDLQNKSSEAIWSMGKILQQKPGIWNVSMGYMP